MRTPRGPTPLISVDRRPGQLGSPTRSPIRIGPNRLAMAGNRTWTSAEVSTPQERSPIDVRSVVGEDTLTTRALVEIATSGDAGLAGLGRC